MGNLESKLIDVNNAIAAPIESVKDSIKNLLTGFCTTPVIQPEEKEIIIKCSIEEMMKAFFKDYVIVWHDPNADNKENQQYITQLNPLRGKKKFLRVKKFCEVFTFTEWEKARDYIKGTQAVCHVVTSGTNGEVLIKEIFENENVCNIYVFCGNKEFHSTWAQNYQKVSCVETHLNSVLSQIQQNLLEWYKKASSLNFNMPAFAPIFNDGDKSEMNHLHLYLKTIPNFRDREQAKTDFLSLSKAIYTDPRNQGFIADFERYYIRYQKDYTLRWYTLESFLYKVTNNCLRIATSDSIQYCRLALKDIEQAIKDQYREKSKEFNGLLYRGAYLSEQEWSSLKENQDKEIEMHGFLSVSKDKKVALNFLRDPSKMVFITIIVPKGPNEEEQGFAEIEEYSQFPQEKEILFNVRSRFTVLETFDDEDLKCRHLVLLYGAQGFRKHVTNKIPVQEISIPSIEDLSCAHCHKKPEEPLFVSIAEGHHSYCKNCIEYGVGPFLCVNKVGKYESAEINGFPLMNSSQKETPFYGYKCCNCRAKRQKSYYICTDCDEKKEKKWCENCFEGTSNCIESGHCVLLETSPFSFWCEEMSANELNHMEFQDGLIDKYSRIFQQAEMYYHNHQYERAIEHYTLYILQNEAKGNHYSLVTSYLSLGKIYLHQGKSEKALENFMKALEIQRAMFKDEKQLQIARTYADIGDAYCSLGDYKKGLEYNMKYLSIFKAMFGDAADDNYVHIASTYGKIGNIYAHIEDYDKAFECYFKCLEAQKIMSGYNDLRVAASYASIGNVYIKKGELEKALEYCMKCLDMQKAVFGENHPDIARSYLSFGSVFEEQKEYEKALEYYFKALGIQRSIFGEIHPDVVASCDKIGRVYQSQEEYDKALEYHLKTLDIMKSLIGENHPDLAVPYNEIGRAYQNQGEFDKALEYYFKGLEIIRSVHGDNYPDLVAFYGNIGNLYEKKGEDKKKALEYYLKALVIFQDSYGDDHPHTISMQDRILKLISLKK